MKKENLLVRSITAHIARHCPIDSCKVFVPRSEVPKVEIFFRLAGQQPSIKLFVKHLKALAWQQDVDFIVEGNADFRQMLERP